MTTINFPSSPIVGQQYTYLTRTWRWNGYAWDLVDVAEEGRCTSGIKVFVESTSFTFYRTFEAPLIYQHFP